MVPPAQTHHNKASGDPCSHLEHETDKWLRLSSWSMLNMKLFSAFMIISMPKHHNYISYNNKIIICYLHCIRNNNNNQKTMRNKLMVRQIMVKQIHLFYGHISAAHACKWHRKATERKRNCVTCKWTYLTSKEWNYGGRCFVGMLT